MLCESRDARTRHSPLIAFHISTSLTHDCTVSSLHRTPHHHQHLARSSPPHPITSIPKALCEHLRRRARPFFPLNRAPNKQASERASMTSSELPPFAQATAGSLGSAVSGSIVYPLDLISTRLQTRGTGVSRTSKNQQSSHAPSQNGFRSLVHALQEVVQKKGLGGLYQGWSSDTISSMLSKCVPLGFALRIRPAVIH